MGRLMDERAGMVAAIGTAQLSLRCSARASIWMRTELGRVWT